MKKKVIVYFHTHWDREWYKNRVSFNFRLVKVFDDVLKKLKNNEIPCFYFDGQVSALIDYLKFRPENEQLIKDLIKKEKLFIGPFYCSTDSFLVSLQSLISNFDLGIKYSQKFGCNKFIGYCADTFGHAKGLPDIFNYFQFDSGIFWRGLGDLPICFEWNNFKSIYIRQGYFHDYLNADITIEKKANLIETQLKKIDDNKQKILLLPLGADHLKVADNIKFQIGEINKVLKNYELVISNPFEYSEIIKPTSKVTGELRDNSRNFILPGVLSSRTDIKQKNAFSQWNLLRIAEPLNAFCFDKKLTKENYQPIINSAKEELIKNHAHDSIYGCSTDEVHNDMTRRFCIANQTSKCVVDEIINELSSKTDNINVINLSDYKYSGLCEIQTDKKLNFGQLIKKETFVDKDLWLDPNRIPITEDFKPIFNYLIYTENAEPFSISSVNTKKSTNDLKITDKSIENSKIKLKISSNHIEITDKLNSKTYKNFLEFTDIADVGDSYNFAPLKKDKKIKAEIINSKAETVGQLCSVLKIELEIKIPSDSNIKGRSKRCIKHKLNLYVTCETNNDLLKFKLEWKNKSKNHLLQASFNFDKPVTQTISDDLTTTITRNFDPDYNIANCVPAPKGIELKTNTAPMQTFVCTQNTGIITKGLNEYEISKNSLSITLLRSTGIISTPKNPSRGVPAGPPIATNDLFELTQKHAEFAVAFTSDEEKLTMLQQAYYGCTFAFWGNLKPTKIADLKQKLVTATYEKSLNIRILDNKKGRILDL